MPITVDCGCGKKFNVKDELAGKKIKCPGCQAVVTVPAPAMEIIEDIIEAPPAPPPAKKAMVIEDEDEAPARSVKKTSRADDDYDDAPDDKGIGKKKKKKKKGSNTGLFIGLGCGAVVLLALCGGGGFAAWYFLVPPSPESAIVGRWVIDYPATKAIYPPDEQKQWDKTTEEEAKGMTFEFKSDKTFEFSRTTLSGSNSQKGTWKVTNVKGSDAILETSRAVSPTMTVSNQENLSVKSRNQIFIGPKDDKSGKNKGFFLKRI